MKRTVCIAILGLFVVASTSGYSARTDKILSPMEIPVVTHGNTKVTLLHIARTTSWSSQFVRGDEDQQGPMYAVPGAYLEFLVERLDEPSAPPQFNESTIKLFQNGRMISTSSPVTAGGASVNENYSPSSQRFGFQPPVVENQRKALILRSYKRGIALDSGHVTIRFTAGFDEDEYMFEFKDIPLY